MSKLTRQLLLPALLSLTAAACSRGEGDATGAEAAMREAKACYEALYLKGEPETFLNGHANAPAMPKEYGEQLVGALRQHLRSLGADRQGVTAVKALRAEMDSTLNVMQVFLALTFGNGTQEEVVVPMVQAAPDGKWMMK